MYDTAEEAHQKLVGSVVVFDGQPVYISRANGGKNKVILTYDKLPLTDDNSNRKEAPIQDPRWDFRNLGSRLGYLNVEEPVFQDKKETLFISRIPARVPRQGLDNRTVRVSSYSGKHPWNWGHLLRNSGTTKMFTGAYPKIDKAFHLITTFPNLYESVAISRKLALVWDRINPINLVYRNEKVGYTEDGTTFNLAQHTSFLKEELTDMEKIKIA